MSQGVGEAPPAGELDAAERMSADELAAVQLERLRWTLRYVHENVAFYRKKFDAAGVSPEDCRSLDDLAYFPVTTKDDLRENYPAGLFAVPPAEIRRIHASSGTTGQPTVVGYTQRDLDTWSDLMARSIRAAGGRPGDVVHVAYGYGLFTGGLGAHYGAERLGCTVIPASGGVTGRQVRLICDLRPRVIMVTPTYMLTILDEFERAGLDAAGSSLQIGIFGAEPWTEEMRAELERRAGLHAVDIYGLSEVMGPGVAVECLETKDGLTVWEDHFYPEIIDPVSGGLLDAGRARRDPVHLADQAGDAADQVPHQGPDPAAARHRAARVPADGADHRALGRHDRAARGQRVPHPDRGSPAARPRPRPALPARADLGRPPRRADRARGGQGRGDGRAAVGRGVRAGCGGAGQHRASGSRSAWPTRARSSGPRARCAGWSIIGTGDPFTP